jgi:hypothetical protein
MWLGVSFPHPNEFTYQAPCSLIAGVPEISLYDMLARISEGFMSRFIEIPIGYDRVEAVAGIENWWKNVLPAGREDSQMIQENDLLLEQRFRRCFYMLHWANMGWGSELRNIRPLEGFLLSEKIRSMFEDECLRAFNRALDTVEKHFGEPVNKALFGTNDIQSVRPPILFRECGDLLRLACCDAVSRRFAIPNGTEHHPGWVRIDDIAANKAIPFLAMIAETSVNNMLEAKKIKKLASTYKPSLLTVEYEIIREAGQVGISTVDWYAVLEKKWNISRKRAEPRLRKLIDIDLVEEKSGVLYSTLATRLTSSFRW